MKTIKKNKIIQLESKEIEILIELLIEINPEKQEQKDFIMGFIKELKK